MSETSKVWTRAIGRAANRLLMIALCLATMGLADAPVRASATPVSGATIWTVAGNGTPEFSGDGGPAISAELALPASVAAGSDGKIVIADDFNNRVRAVSPTGIIATLAGNGHPGSAGDGGPATAAELGTPTGVAVDAAGGVLIADQIENRIRRVDPGGDITTIAGTGAQGFSGDGGPAISAQLNGPQDIAVDGAGDILISDQGNNRVRRITPDGTIVTIAGTGVAGSTGDNGPALAAELNAPAGLAVDPAGNVLVAEADGNRIRRIDPAGNITTIGGTGAAGFAGDGGSATSAQLNRPQGVTVDAAGGVLVADTENDRIRRIGPDGRIVTIAGNGVHGFSGDGGSATAAALAEPYGVAVDPAGNILVTDLGNQRVRLIAGRDGPPGPPGAIGPVGPVGPAGPTGPPGSLVASIVDTRLAGRLVVVRYVLNRPARVRLAVAARGRPSRIVAAAHGQLGTNVVRWRRPRGEWPGKAIFRLTVIATDPGTRATASAQVRIRHAARQE